MYSGTCCWLLLLILESVDSPYLKIALWYGWRQIWSVSVASSRSWIQCHSWCICAFFLLFPTHERQFLGTRLFPPFEGLLKLILPTICGRKVSISAVQLSAGSSEAWLQLFCCCCSEDMLDGSPDHAFKRDHSNISCSSRIRDQSWAKRGEHDCTCLLQLPLSLIQFVCQIRIKRRMRPAPVFGPSWIDYQKDVFFLSLDLCGLKKSYLYGRSCNSCLLTKRTMIDGSRFILIHLENAEKLRQSSRNINRN